jgi:hypothetical protein
MKKRRASRRPDGGSITIMAIFLLATLMAMAGLAVDLGFLYTRSRMMYAVADSAVAVGMKDLVAGKSSSISGDISDIAGKYGGAYTITPVATASQVQVTVTATYPLFFAKMIGFPSRTLTVVAIGKKNASPPPILALGAGCGGGVTINGQGAMTVNGDVESNGSLTFSTGPPGPIINGSAAAECGESPATKNPWDTVTGSYGTGGPFTDPFSPYVLPACTYGNTTSPNPIAGWDMSTTPPTLPPGVYCSNGPLQLISPGTGFTATGVTLISIGGTIQIGASSQSTITPSPSSPNGIVAYSTAAGGCTPGAIFSGGPAGPDSLTIGGALYAPNGCVNVQQNGPMSIGSVVGNTVNISNNSAWTIGSVAGGGGNAWQMSQ